MCMLVSRSFGQQRNVNRPFVLGRAHPPRPRRSGSPRSGGQSGSSDGLRFGCRISNLYVKGSREPLLPLGGGESKTWAWHRQVLGSCKRGGPIPRRAKGSRLSLPPEHQHLRGEDLQHLAVLVAGLVAHVTMPRSGLERDGRISVTSLVTCKHVAGPGRLRPGDLRRPRRSCRRRSRRNRPAAASSPSRHASRSPPARRRNCPSRPLRRCGTAADRTRTANRLISAASIRCVPVVKRWPTVRSSR
jgi:hypothetical protein